VGAPPRRIRSGSRRRRGRREGGGWRIYWWHHDEQPALAAIPGSFHGLLARLAVPD